MGIFESFFKGFNQGRERARDEAYQRRQSDDRPVKVVEPSVGRIVELQVTEQDDILANFYMEHLITCAEALEQVNVQWETTDKTIRLTFESNDLADLIRRIWKI